MREREKERQRWRQRRREGSQEGGREEERKYMETNIRGDSEERERKTQMTGGKKGDKNKRYLRRKQR